MDIRDLPSFIPAGASPSSPPVSTLGSFSRGAVSMLPLGKQAYAGIAGVAENKPYRQEREELDTEEAQDKALNPTARILGQVTGAVAPAIATAGASAPESLGEAALQGAGVGAGFGAGNAIDTLSEGGGAGKAASEVALGAGLGAAGGAGGKLLTDTIGPTLSRLGPQAEEVRAEEIAALFNGTTRQIRALPGKNPTQTMNAIGDAIANRTVDGEPLISNLDRLPERLDKFISFQKQAGKTIGDTIRDAKVEPIPIGGIANELETSGGFSILSPSDKDELNAIVQKARLYADKNGEISFDRLQRLKSDIGDEAFKGQGKPVLQHAYHVLSDIQDNYLDKTSSAISKPAFDAAKHDYQVSARVIPMMRMGVSREIGQKTPALLPAMAAVTGHPVGALLAMMKNRVSQIGSSTLFNASSAVPDLIPQAASRIPSMSGADALAAKRDVVYDYLRQSNDPNYAKAKKDSQEK